MYKRRFGVWGSHILFLLLLPLVWSGSTSRCLGADRRVPIIFSTDLFHPPDDPDDTFDLATLFALREFNIRGIVRDNARGAQGERPGRPRVEQMMHITGRKVRYAPGLPEQLRNATDQGRWQPEEFQGGVDLILSCLRDSKEKLVIFSTGSCRDVAAAFNRQPELFRKNVKALYYVVGTGGEGNVAQDDWNVKLDRWAYFRMFDVGVSFYWCSTRRIMKADKGGPFSTSYWADQDKVLRACPPPVQNFFVYCLTKSKADPMAFLSSGPHELPDGNLLFPGRRRRMWCTGPLCHAAGRGIYRRGEGDFVALTPTDAARAGLAAERVDLFDFVPVAAKPKRAPLVLPLRRTDS